MPPIDKPIRDSFDLSGSVYLITSDGQILNLPIPSESPCDPLNWSSKKRVLVLLAIGVFSFVGLVLPQGASLMMNGLSAEFSVENSKPFAIDTLVSAPTLFMGLGAFIWIPLSLALGRRPVFVIAATLMFLSSLAAGFARSYYELLASVCVLGLTEGFSLSTALLMVIDLTFIHQRPSVIAMVWSIAGFCGASFLSSVPFMTNQGTKWRSFYLYWCIPAGISCIMAFLSPETHFKRPAVAFDGRIILQSATEKITIYSDVDDQHRNKALPNTPSQSALRAFADWFHIPRSNAGCWIAMARSYPQILMCFLNPLIFWVLLLTGVNFSGMVFIGATYELVLSKTPYRLSSNLIVLVNVSAGVGALLAWPAAGRMVASLCRSFSHRNRGVREAEHYLVGYVLPVLTGGLSTLLYGLAIKFKWHFSTFYVAYGLNAFSFTALAIANTLWVTEAFPRWAAAALVVVGGGSYATSFGMSFVLMPWIRAQGYLGVGVQLAALQVVLGGIIVPVAFWGKSVRQHIYSRWAIWKDGALRPQ